MLLSSNKSFPIWILVAIALQNGCHLKGVYKYHRYERPKDRWDFKVWDLRTPISSSSPASLFQQHVTNLKIKIFGQTTRRQWDNNNNNRNKNITSFDSFDTFEPFSNETIRVGVSIINADEPDDEPYRYKNHLHQPLSKKNSPFRIYFHIVCGSVPIFAGAANLLDFMRTSSRTGITTRTHRVLGNLFFVFGLVTAISGTVLAPNMRFSHYKPVLCTCVALLGVATGACILFSVKFLRRAIRIRKNTADFDSASTSLLYKAHILGHRVWALRSWLLMEFFLLWARILMGMNFYLTGHKHSFVIGGIAALLTVPFMLEWTVRWHLRRTSEGFKYRILGPLPWASNEDLITLKTSTDPKKID